MGCSCVHHLVGVHRAYLAGRNWSARGIPGDLEQAGPRMASSHGRKVRWNARARWVHGRARWTRQGLLRAGYDRSPHQSLEGKKTAEVVFRGIELETRSTPIVIYLRSQSIKQLCQSADHCGVRVGLFAASPSFRLLLPLRRRCFGRLL